MGHVVEKGLRGVVLAAMVGAAFAAAFLPAAAAELSGIVAREDAPLPQRLAAREVRRYVYQRTGRLLPIFPSLEGVPAGAAIVVGVKDDPHVLAALPAEVRLSAEKLAAEQYLLKTVGLEDRPVHVVCGGDAVGSLYGAYRLAEHLGVRFYLHGDVLPDEPVPAKLAPLDETGRPLFDRRGIQPFHDFPEGPDWWNADDSKAILAQLPKMRMNFFGLHTYPQGGVGPEPLTWIGPAGDARADGTVKRAYPSRHFTTGNRPSPGSGPAWGYEPMNTSDYRFGAAELFEADDFGPEAMRGLAPWTDMTDEEACTLFDRMGRVLDESFRFARGVGVKTCIGTETPLVIPSAVQERLRAAGKDPADPAVVQELYEGMFRRIAATHPLDYYWLWTPEGWTWSAVSQQQIDATLSDFKAAIAAAERVDAPFTLATCGWVLGPPQRPSLFDEFLPKTMPMSCINRQVGHTPVEPGFAQVQGRDKWAIPWMEDDPALTSPQLWAGRMRKDAADALEYGCTGLMGIHWRTRILGPNVSALARAAWDQSGWNARLAGERPAAPVPEGPEGGLYARFPGVDFADTELDTLYQSVRYDVSAYHFDVPNGAYRVTLRTCEPAYREAGRRVFGVRIQGKQVMDRLDIFERVGANRALDFTSDPVEVADGRLTIDFVHIVEYPCVAAIEIEGPVTRKINCGGPAWDSYSADWPPDDGPGRDRFLPTDDFYADWALAEFGPAVAQRAAAIFTRLDGHLPRPSDWVNGPGGIKPDARPWEQVAKDYAFVDELAALEREVTTPAARERFLYWLNQFRAMRASARVSCTWHQAGQALERARAAGTPAERERLARDEALPLRRELVARVAEVQECLLASITTYGGMGNVCNWQQHILPGLLDRPGQQLAELLGEPLPADAQPGSRYTGPARLFVPTVRTSLLAGEPLRLKAVVLGANDPQPVVSWRALGEGEYHRIPMDHVARGVYTVSLPADAIAGDLEYYVEAQLPGGPAVWPPAAPAVNQAVVVVQP